MWANRGPRPPVGVGCGSAHEADPINAMLRLLIHFPGPSGNTAETTLWTPIPSTIFLERSCRASASFVRPAAPVNEVFLVPLGEVRRENDYSPMS